MKSIMRFITTLGLVIFVVTFGTTISADSQRFVDLEYDDGGNLITVDSKAQHNPPDVITLEPAFINIDRTRTITATGTGLLNVQVSVSAAGLFVRNVKSTLTSVTFNLAATTVATLGNATIEFTTALGSDTENIIIAERAPDIRAEPNPILLLANAQPRQIKLIFDKPGSDDITYTISVTDPSIATTTTSSFVLLAQETEKVIELTGLVLGNTGLKISSGPFSEDTLPIFVTSRFEGSGDSFSAPVGVVIGTDDPTGLSGGAIFSRPVGVVIGTEDPTGISANSIFGKPVGVILGTEDPRGFAGSAVFGKPVGVILGTENPRGEMGNAIYGNPTGVIIGPLLEQATPSTITASTSDLTVTGFNLQDVNSVVLLPADDIVISGFNVNVEGTAIDISLIVGADPLLGERELIITATENVELVNGENLKVTVE